MLADFAAVIASYGKLFTKITSTKFEYNGVTYDDVSSTTAITGVMLPITSEDRMELLKLGHSLIGKVSLYVGADVILTENDVIVDSDNVEWVVLPYSVDWSEYGNYIKYRLSRKVIPEV